MQLQAPLRLPAQAVNGTEAVRPRRESERPPPSVVRGLNGGRAGAPGDPAAVLHFGSAALSLARGANDDAEGDAPASERAQREPSAEEAVERSPFAPADLSPEERRELNELRQRDREVRTHEQAHKSAGGPHAGSIELQTRAGPDGRRYAVEGSVPIDVSPVAGDPAATLRKMDIVQRAANAPASPSGADRQVAAEAARISRQARAQVAADRYAQAQALVTT